MVFASNCTPLVRREETPDSCPYICTRHLRFMTDDFVIPAVYIIHIYIIYSSIQLLAASLFSKISVQCSNIDRF